MSLERVRIPSPNYSSRGGTAVRLIVLHTAEGARTYTELGNFFANPASGVSSHVGIDDTPDVVGEYVARSGKAWTQGNANPYSVAAELCAFAEWGSLEWQSHPGMLANAALWLAEESEAFGIPLTRLSASQAQDGKSKGVCEHVDLGAAGGGHWDCGPAFPIDDVIALAKGGSNVPTEIQPPEDDMIIKETNGQVYQLIYDGGASYWRTLPANAAARIPAASVIVDDGSLLSLWKVGSK